MNSRLTLGFYGLERLDCFAAMNSINFIGKIELIPRLCGIAHDGGRRTGRLILKEQGRLMGTAKNG